MLSTTCKYAIHALVYLAERYKDGPVHIQEIAEHERIPKKFLEAILLELRNAKILHSKKGKGGGYYLPNDPAKTTIASVMRIVDGPISMLPCVSLYFYQKCKNCDEHNCGLHNIMAKVRDATLAVVEGKTLASLVEGKESI